MSALPETTVRARRRRRTPQEAEAEIVGAAEALLRERPFRDLTVDEVMRRTDLSRPSFYVYFRDRHQLVLRVVERIGQEMFESADRWFKGGQDGPAEVRTAMTGLVASFRQHGRVLKALSDAASDDSRVEDVYGGLVAAFVAANTMHIESEIAAGRITPVDAAETAKALVWMSERYMLQAFGNGSATDADEELVCETLVTIYNRTLYSRDV